MAEKILAIPKGTYEDYDAGPLSWVVGHSVPKGRIHAYALEYRRLVGLPEVVTAPVQALQLGEAAVVALPGEVFVEIGLGIKSRGAAKPLFVVSLANGHIGYICTDRALQEEGGMRSGRVCRPWGVVDAAPAMEAMALSLLGEVGAR